MAGKDITFTRKQRIIVSAVIWLLVAPLLVGLTVMIWWFGLAFLAIAAWTTYDYIRKGDMAGHITEAMSKTGKVAKGAQVVLRGDDVTSDDIG